MTENQWPQDDGSAVAPAIYRATPDTAPEIYPAAPESAVYPSASEPDRDGESGAAAKTEAAKDEAGAVAREAADAAQNVTETAKDEAAAVAAELRSNAKDLFMQARSDLVEQAGIQQQKVAGGLRSVAEELHSMATDSDQPGVGADLVRQAAQRSSTVASWLEGRDPGSLLEEVKGFARQRPVAFLALAAGAGILAGRLARGLSAGAPPTGTAGTTATPTPVGAAPVATTGLAPRPSFPSAETPDLYPAEPASYNGESPTPVNLPVPGTPGIDEPFTGEGRH
jgi:hypothetical protein